MIRRLFNSIELILSSDRLGVKFSRTKDTWNNWGDALNAYLIPILSGKKIIHYSEYLNTGLTKTLGGIGSILDNNVTKNLYVWGSGLKSPKSPIPVVPSEVFAIRGKLSQARLHQLGIGCPDVFGDPAIILPRYYTPRSDSKKYRLGIIPHYIDSTSDKLNSLRTDPDVRMLDIRDPIETFVDRLNECEVIASSSLHGLIAADSYNIPRVWLNMSDNILGGDYKFQDYFSSTNLLEPNRVFLDPSVTPKLLISRAQQPSRLPDVDKLLSAFPFKH